MWALLFDLDGTLADTNAVHEVAWREVLADFDVELSSEGFHAHISGRSNPAIVEYFLPHLDLEHRRALIDHKETLFRKWAQDLTASPGLMDLVSWAVEQRARIAVVTNAPRANARHVLEVLHLDQQFEVIMGAEDVAQPKPHAEPYLRTAEALGVPAERCFAFEDSPSGVRSAVAAGIAVAGLTTGHTALELEREGATPVVPDFTHASLCDAVRALVSSLT